MCVTSGEEWDEVWRLCSCQGRVNGVTPGESGVVVHGLFERYL